MSEAVHTAERLAELQALPLDRKIQISQARIIEWYQRWNGKVVVSFSGGKDSTVLLHLVRTIYPDVPAVFSNTGLEYPEIQRFVRETPNAVIVSPKMTFPNEHSDSRNIFGIRNLPRLRVNHRTASRTRGGRKSMEQEVNQ